MFKVLIAILVLATMGGCDAARDLQFSAREVVQGTKILGVYRTNERGLRIWEPWYRYEVKKDGAFVSITGWCVCYDPENSRYEWRSKPEYRVTRTYRTSSISEMSEREAKVVEIRG